VATLETWTRGCNCESLRAAASMELAALMSSLSATTVGSYGSTHSVPVTYTTTAIQYDNQLTRLSIGWLVGQSICLDNH